jgi:chromosome segregation ATPase
MAAIQNFRSAFNGFNRDDVVHYIEYIHNTHRNKVGELNNQLQSLQEQLDAAQAELQQREDTAAKLAEALAKIDALEQALEEARSHPPVDTTQELEAYRRAEQAERNANLRVIRLYEEANGILADATTRADESAAQVSRISEEISGQLIQLQDALTAGANTIRDAAAAMYAIKPASQDE